MVMRPISYARHRFPSEVICHAVWLYLRWVLKFGPAVARNLRLARPKPDDRWHLDEMVVSINGQCMYLWRAVDSEGGCVRRPESS
jgi:putative transposase